MNKHIRVFVVEDEPVSRLKIAAMLELKGFVLAGEAGDGKEAIEKICIERPDVVLMDIVMPGEIDGLDVTRLIQKQCPTPVVVLSSHDAPDLVERASNAGAGAYLVKPPNLDEIERTIAIAIARHGDLMSLHRLNTELEQKNNELKVAISEINILRKIVPMCAYCKGVRDDDGYWSQVEEYISKSTKVAISHGICPSCIKKHHPEEYESLTQKGII